MQGFQPSELLEEFRARGRGGASLSTSAGNPLQPYSAQSILEDFDMPSTDKPMMNTTMTTKAMMLDKMAGGRSIDETPKAAGGGGGESSARGGGTGSAGTGGGGSGTNGDPSLAASALSDVRSGTSEVNPEMESIRRKTMELVENVPWISQRLIVKLSRVSQSVVSNWIRGQSSLRSEKAKVVCNTMKKLMPSLYPAALNGYTSQQAFEAGENVSLQELLGENASEPTEPQPAVDKFYGAMRGSSARGAADHTGTMDGTSGTTTGDRGMSDPMSMAGAFLNDLTSSSFRGRGGKNGSGGGPGGNVGGVGGGGGSGGEAASDALKEMQSFFADVSSSIGGPPTSKGGENLKGTAASSVLELDRVLGGGMPLSPSAAAGTSNIIGGEGGASYQSWNNNGSVDDPSTGT